MKNLNKNYQNRKKNLDKILIFKNKRKRNKWPQVLYHVCSAHLSTKQDRFDNRFAHPRGEIFKFHNKFNNPIWMFKLTISNVVWFIYFEEWKKYFLQEGLKVLVLVLDKLIEEKRYDHVWKLYNDHVKTLPKIPSSFLNAITFSLMKSVKI